MTDINSVVVIGRIGRDAELKFTSGGTAVTGFSVAVGSGTKDKPRTNWLSVKVWGKYAEAMTPHLKKGVQICISGALEVTSWEKDGQKYERVEIVAQNMQLLGGKRDETSPVKPDAPFEDDIPF